MTDFIRGDRVTIGMAGGGATATVVRKPSDGYVELLVDGHGEYEEIELRRVTLVERCEDCARYDQGLGKAEKCPSSKRVCRHHCACSWVHDRCCWCGAEFGENT